MTTAARKVLAVIEEFRKVDPTITSIRMAAFCYIACHPSCSARDLYTYLGVSQASMAECTKYLDKHGLIESVTVTDPYPRQSYSLSKKGERICASLKHYIE